MNAIFADYVSNQAFALTVSKRQKALLIEAKEWSYHGKGPYVHIQYEHRRTVSALQTKGLVELRYDGGIALTRAGDLLVQLLYEAGEPEYRMDGPGTENMTLLTKAEWLEKHG